MHNNDKPSSRILYYWWNKEKANMNELIELETFAIQEVYEKNWKLFKIIDLSFYGFTDRKMQIIGYN